MRVLILGADGYLGWPTAMHFARRGDDVYAVDNFSKRAWELELGIETLEPVPTLHRRIRRWQQVGRNEIHLRVGDLTNHRFVYKLLEEIRPDAIVHYAEQPSAPYSMQSRANAVATQVNNIVGTLNLLFAIRSYCPDVHLVKLGTMGEYGTPDIDIEEGYITIAHNGRSDVLPFPKQPGSFYHLSKVHDSHNIAFVCKVWGLRATDLNQGVVYGIDTDETVRDRDLQTSFHYDAVFGTVLNRFLVQAACDVPLTVYGQGGQTRGFLNIRDTLQCVELAVRNPAAAGELRVFNQFTEQFSVTDLASRVQAAAARAGKQIDIQHVPNPRIEKEAHYYNAKHSKLPELGLKPNLLTDQELDRMFETVQRHSSRVNHDLMLPTIAWAQK